MVNLIRCHYCIPNINVHLTCHRLKFLYFYGGTVTGTSTRLVKQRATLTTKLRSVVTNHSTLPRNEHIFAWGIFCLGNIQGCGFSIVTAAKLTSWSFSPPGGGRPDPRTTSASCTGRPRWATCHPRTTSP